MVPPFDQSGNLPPGIHQADWQEFVQRFGTTPYRLALIAGLKRALNALKRASCKMVYIDGSFVTTKQIPGDYDACYSVDGLDLQQLDPVLQDFSNGRAAQKNKYLGELFPAELPEGISGLTFLEFFQIDKETTELKGVVALDLRTLP